MTSLADATTPAAANRKLGPAAMFHSPIIALTLAALFWSGNFIAGRALRDHIDPVTLNFSRWLIALILLAPFVWRDMLTSVAVVRREWRLILGLGATGIASFHTLNYLALQTTTATNALLTLSLAPIAILAGAATLGLERPNRRQLAGAITSIVGAAILITRGEFATIHDFVVGDLWMLVSVVIWAAYSLLLRRRPADLPPSVALAASIGVGLILLVPFLLLGSGTSFTAFVSLASLAGIGYVAVFASVLAFMFWSYGVSRLGPSRSGQFILLMPVFGAALAATLLGERLAPAEIAGALLVLAGIVIVEWRSQDRVARNMK